jgi:hypothetical protein
MFPVVPSLKKYHIVNALIAGRGYRRYLEICTPITGGQFSRIDRTPLQCCHRLMYRCAADFEDNLEVTFRNAEDRILCRPDAAVPYDIVLVDPFHSFECSARDLSLAFELVRPGGMMVVHDCSPAGKEICGPEFHGGCWCGVTYCAYIEFVLCRHDLTYCTVDTDFGCGMIHKVDAGRGDIESRRRLWELWSQAKEQTDDMFNFFSGHRRELLNLVSVRKFRAAERVTSSPLLQLAEWRDTFATLLHH